LIPGNEFSVGNDNPVQYQIVDEAGILLINSITWTSSAFWDAESEYSVLLVPPSSSTEPRLCGHRTAALFCSTLRN